jgi:dUTPase
MKPIRLDEVIIETLAEDVRLPEYVSDGDSGMDVRAREHCLLVPGQTQLFKLGFKIGMPKHPWHEEGWRWECQARPRSGVSLKTSLTMPNSPGTIDNFYSSELGIILRNDMAPQIGEQETVRALDGRDIPISALPPFLRPRAGKVSIGTVWIKPGDRIAQLVFASVVRPGVIKPGKVAKNRDGGFGSSGIE